MKFVAYKISINDYNTARETTYPVGIFYALGSSSDIGGASHVLYGRQVEK